ncbi:MAG: hypothetical protein N2441_07470 [Rhodocyclaceae bacterium]|nr:hypothetical protein [Rhodocyclaceae bacterium]
MKACGGVGERVAGNGRRKVSRADVEERLERLARFKACFPAPADEVLQEAGAAMGAPEEAIRDAERQGLYRLVQVDDGRMLRNGPDFPP